MEKPRGVPNGGYRSISVEIDRKHCDRSSGRPITVSVEKFPTFKTRLIELYSHVLTRCFRKITATHCVMLSSDLRTKSIVIVFVVDGSCLHCTPNNINVCVFISPRLSKARRIATTTVNRIKQTIMYRVQYNSSDNNNGNKKTLHIQSAVCAGWKLGVISSPLIVFGNAERLKTCVRNTVGQATLNFILIFYFYFNINLNSYIFIRLS